MNWLTRILKSFYRGQREAFRFHCSDCDGWDGWHYYTCARWQ